MAAEIDPARGRHVVLGRCRFIDEADRFLGFEHPSGFESHRRVLQIWKGHTLPQPATFWTREVWVRCGPFDPAVGPFLDYDYFCRVSREFDFHYVDQVLANYRLHATAQTASMTDAQRLERAIHVSRRHWGPRSRPEYWQLLASWLTYRLDRRRRAVGLSAGRETGGGVGPAAIGHAIAGALPPRRPHRRGGPARRSRADAARPSPDSSPSRRPAVYRLARLRGRSRDGWVGPVLVHALDVPRPRNCTAGVPWSAHFQPSPSSATASPWRATVSSDSFAIRVPSLASSPAARAGSRPTSGQPDRRWANDHRPLAYRLDALEVRPSRAARAS